MVQSLLQFLHQYREKRFKLAKIAAKKLTKDAGIPVVYKSKNLRKKTK